MRLHATHANDVWCYDFPIIRDARSVKVSILTMIDKLSRRFLTINCARRIRSIQVIQEFVSATMIHGIPEYIRLDNGPKFIAKNLLSWLFGIRVKTAYIEGGSPWGIDFFESFNGNFRDSLFDGEIFYSRNEAQIIVEEWVKRYN